MSEEPLVTNDPDIPFRYYVLSRSEEGIRHTVDMTDRGGHGGCTCVHYSVAAVPNLKRHGRFIPFAKKREGVSECYHIGLARNHMYVETIIPMLAGFSAGLGENEK